MKNLESYIGKFIKVTDGKHDGAYAYVESTHECKGGTLGIVSGDKDGRFECLVFPTDVVILTDEDELEIARQSACEFYEQDIKSKSDYYNGRITAGAEPKSVQYVIDILVERCNIYKSINI